MNPRSTAVTTQIKYFIDKRFKRLVVWSIPLVSAPLLLSLILMRISSSPPVVTPLAVPSPQPSAQIPPYDQRSQPQLVIPSPIVTNPIIKTRKPSTQPRPSTTQNVWSQASFPVESFQAYTSGFGWRWQEEGEEFHSGLDIAAPLGSYIRNWWVGQVITVAQDSFCGTHLIVQSGSWQAVYCHLEGQVTSSPKGSYLSVPNSNIMIVQGQWVHTGVPIGRVGMTGRTTGPHLHWGLKYAGEWIDPALVLRKMYASEKAD